MKVLLNRGGLDDSGIAHTIKVTYKHLGAINIIGNKEGMCHPGVLEIYEIND